MGKTELMVPTRYYARLAELLVRDRVDVSALLAGLGLSPQLLTHAQGLVPFSQVDRLLQHLVAGGVRSDLAFDLGKLLSASAHSFVGFGMLNSVNLDQALRFEAQYFRLILPSFQLRYHSGPDFGELTLTPRVAMSHVCLSFHLEAMGMAALREVSDLIGDRRPPCRLQLSIPEPPHHARYREIRDLQCRFGVASAPGVSLRLLGDPRALPLSMADANARSLAEERCRALVQQMADVRELAGWVAMTLREVSEGLPTLSELAGMLNLSPRTLNRYLEREGTTYRELSGRVQHELACERLASGAMSVTEVAYSLGFGDTSNFARAFRARSGCSPSQYQRQTRPDSGPINAAASMLAP